MGEIKNKYDSDLVFDSAEPVYYKSDFLIDCSLEEFFRSAAEKETVEIAGRIVRRRKYKTLVFAELYGDGTEVQLVIDSNVSMSAWNYFCKFVAVGDIVGICGEKGRTKNGTDSVWVRKITLLTKTMTSLPDKYHRVKSAQTRRRAAYLDVMMNRFRYGIFQQRSRIIQNFRNVLIENGYLEVDTPILSTVECASNARQFVAHHNVLNTPVYLRVSAEIQLKQMILCGYSKIFEFCRNFRNEGMDKYHRQEFLNLEIFSAYSTIADMKELTVRMIKSCCDQSGVLTYHNVNYTVGGIPTYDIHKEIYECFGIDILGNESLESLKLMMREKALINTESEGVLTNRNACINRLADACVNKDGFYFLKGYPVELYPLCKTEESTRIADMEYLFFNELCIAQFCREETDPERLKELLVSQAYHSDKDVSVDEDFLHAASYGLPPMCGVGLSMERLIMLLCGCDSLYESNFFHLTKK